MRRIAAIAIVSTLTLVGCSSADEPEVDVTSTDVTAAPSEEVITPTEPSETMSSSASETEPAVVPDDGITLRAELTGTAEIPGPGDPAASGAFNGILSPQEASAELCYTLEVVATSSQPTAAHIHAGAEGESGPVVLTLTVPTEGPVDECIEVPAGDANELFQSTETFYVNVHSDQHPDGAVRGQLQAG